MRCAVPECQGHTADGISAHFAEIYGASVSKETISRIADKVLEEMNEWTMQPLDQSEFSRRRESNDDSSWNPSCHDDFGRSAVFSLEPFGGGR